jgi:hypothetical protein
MQHDDQPWLSPAALPLPYYYCSTDSNNLHTKYACVVFAASLCVLCACILKTEKIIVVGGVIYDALGT